MDDDPHPDPQIDSRSSYAGSTSPSESQAAVLGNFDLLQIIFFFFEPESDVSSECWALSLTARHELLNAALTCKVFVDPAMNVLWRSMDSMAPLVKVLPTFVRINNDYTISGAILDDHLHRIEQYARRIRRLRFEVQDPGRQKLPSFIYQLLATLHPCGLLPALTHLFIPSLLPRSGFDLHSFTFLAVSSLSSLEVSGIQYKTESSVATILKTYSVKAPAIKHLVLGDWITHSTAQFLPHFRQLTYLTLNLWSNRILETGVLRKCSEIRTLTRLKLILSIWSLLSPYEKTIESVNFSAPLDLEVSGLTINVAELLRKIPIAPLRSIGLKLHTRRGAGASGDIDLLIQQLIRTGQTQAIVIEEEYGWAFDWEAFTPLVRHACNHIHSLEISSPASKGCYSFLELCGTLQWPELRSLKLRCNVKDNREVVLSPSIEELFTLVCPKLQSFDIRLL